MASKDFSFISRVHGPGQLWEVSMVGPTRTVHLSPKCGTPDTMLTATRTSTRTPNLPYKSGPAELSPTEGTPGSHHSRLRRGRCRPTWHRHVSPPSPLSLHFSGSHDYAVVLSQSHETIKESTIKWTSPVIFMFIMRYSTVNLGACSWAGSPLGGPNPSLWLGFGCLYYRL